MTNEQKHTPGALPYFIDVYGHIYRWEKVEGGEKSVPVANWQGSGSAKESIALIDQANAAESLRAEVERLKNGVRELIDHSGNWEETQGLEAELRALIGD